MIQVKIVPIDNAPSKNKNKTILKKITTVNKQQKKNSKHSQRQNFHTFLKINVYKHFSDKLKRL